MQIATLFERIIAPLGIVRPRKLTTSVILGLVVLPLATSLSIAHPEDTQLTLSHAALNIDLPHTTSRVEHLQELLAKPVLKSMMIPATKYEARRSGHKPVFVIHETCSPGTATLKQVTKPDYKASFHALILRDGTIVEMVPANKTAWTAGHSEFEDQSNHSGYKNVTVNHFAYQVELESPADGYWCAPGSTKCIDGGGRGTTHSGYTDEQYVALAWLAVKTGIAPERITTHAYVDRSGTRTDPRSFNWNKFWYYYDLVPDREKTISLGIE